MSKLSVTQIETKDATTPLTLSTGNNIGGFIKIEAANDTITVSDHIFMNTDPAVTNMKLNSNLLQRVIFGNPIDTGFEQHPGGAYITHTSNTLTLSSYSSGRAAASEFSFTSPDQSLHYATITSTGMGVGFLKSSPAFPLDVGGITSTDSLRVVGTDEANNTIISGNVEVDGVIYSNSFIGIGQGFANMNVITGIGYQIWNVPRGVRRWKVTLVGGGGCGGGAQGTAGYNGNGGGSGGVCIGFYDYVPGVQTMAMNVGRGGLLPGTLNANGFSGNSTNVNYNSVWMFANAGTGGANSWFGGNVNAIGIGGAASGGTLNLTGDEGGSGGLAAATNPLYPEGGHTPLGYGQGGIIGPSLTGANGTNATGYGAGGGPGRNTSGTTLRRGGAAGAGVIIIEW